MLNLAQYCGHTCERGVVENLQIFVNREADWSWPSGKFRVIVCKIVILYESYVWKNGEEVENKYMILLDFFFNFFFF